MENIRTEKNYKYRNLIWGVALILAGILFATLRSAFVSVPMTLTGGMLIVYGATRLAEKDYIGGGTAVLAGVAVTVCGWLLIKASLMITGTALIVYGIVLVCVRVGKLKSASLKEAAAAMLKPVLAAAAGILLTVCGVRLSDALFITTGILAVLTGILTIIPPLRKKTASDIGVGTGDDLPERGKGSDKAARNKNGAGKRAP